MTSIRRGRSLIFYWNMGMLLVVGAYAGWRYLRSRELHRLAAELGYTGEARLFPIAYFRERVPIGVGPGSVWARLDGYEDVSYYIMPIVGTDDSVLVQRFRYPLRWDQLDLDVEYSKGVVRDIAVNSDANFGARELDPSEAYARLDWQPPARHGAGPGPQ